MTKIECYCEVCGDDKGALALIIDDQCNRVSRGDYICVLCCRTRCPMRFGCKKPKFCKRNQMPKGVTNDQG